MTWTRKYIKIKKIKKIVFHISTHVGVIKIFVVIIIINHIILRLIYVLLITILLIEIKISIFIYF